MKNKILTAEEFFDKRSEELGFINWTNVIVHQEWEILEKLPIEFAKIHVKKALKRASKKAKMTGIAYGNDKSISDYEVDKDSILNAYDLNLIK